MKDATQFHIRPARLEEAGLFYTPHPEEDKRLGTVGHVRMDFGRSGNEFWHTWWPRGPEELNSPAFKAELQQIVGKLREDVLKSRFAMERFCYDHGGKIDGGYVQNYGYIVETERYRYCLRCSPSPGDYNGYLTAYDLAVQRQNMARDKPLVGHVSFANGDTQEFTDAEAFLKCIRDELPYRPTTGFRYEVLTDDPSVRKQVDDMIFDFYGKGTARQLIESGSGTITPYGVVYDNGMKLEQVYDGRFFPCYYYEPNAITVAVTPKAEPEDTEHITWLYLPVVQEEIDRALLRGGITDPADVRLRLENSQLPNEVDVLLDMEYETLSDLNELAEATDGLSKADMEKLGAVVMLARPKSAAQIKNLAKSLDLFDFAPGVHTPQEYGKYMIQKSGRFEYDENLDAFYDYEKYGTERMNAEDGMFTDRGYIAYKGYYSMEEVMNGGQSNHMVMGGLSR